MLGNIINLRTFVVKENLQYSLVTLLKDKKQASFCVFKVSHMIDVLAPSSTFDSVKRVDRFFLDIPRNHCVHDSCNKLSLISIIQTLI